MDEITLTNRYIERVQLGLVLILVIHLSLKIIDMERYRMEKICKDLSGEYDYLDGIVDVLDEKQWGIITPFYGWSIKDEISHIAYFDSTARLAATDPDGFAKHLEEIFSDFTDFDKFHEKTLSKGRSLSPSKLLLWWRDERQGLVDVLSQMNPKDRIPWYGPSMSALSFATARIMETWAHGQDILDVLQIKRAESSRIKHIAHIGVTTFGWSYKNKKMDVPDVSVRVELEVPSGEKMYWGESESENIITGTAMDFCQVVTQRRNVVDTKLSVKGAVAKQWMQIAQAFAGPPEKGPEPGQRAI